MDTKLLALAKKYAASSGSAASPKLDDYTVGNVLIAGEDGKIVDGGFPAYMGVVSNPEYIQSATRRGKMHLIADIGDSFEVTRRNQTLTFDFIGFDHDTPVDPNFSHSTTVQLHSAFDSIEYDYTEALYYAEEELPAGTYYFTLPQGYDEAYGGGKSYYFTLSLPVNKGGVIMFPWDISTQASSVNISTYPDRSSKVAIESNISVTEGSVGVELTPINNPAFIRNGSGDYVTSAIRQWLNSANVASEIWSPQTNYDRPLSFGYSSDGFLNGMDPDFVKILAPCIKRVSTATALNQNKYVDLTTDAVFLLSQSEIGGVSQGIVNEGPVYEYYNMLIDSVPTNKAVECRIKYYNGEVYRWWTRSQNILIPNQTMAVNLEGNIISNRTHYHFAICPGCTIV